MAKKTTFFVRIRARDFQAIDRRINNTHIGSARFQNEQIVLRARHAQHVAERAENDIWFAARSRAPCRSSRATSHKPGNPAREPARSRSATSDRARISRCEWVCPPQTSIRTHGLVMMRRISSTIFRASASSRYSSRYFMNRLRPCDGRVEELLSRFQPRIDVGNVQFSQLLHSFERLVSLRRLRFVHFAERKTDMDQNIIADLHLGRVLETNLLHNSAKVRSAHPDAVSVGAGLNEFPGYRRDTCFVPVRWRRQPC